MKKTIILLLFVFGFYFIISHPNTIAPKFKRFLFKTQY